MLGNQNRGADPRKTAEKGKENNIEESMKLLRKKYVERLIGQIDSIGLEMIDLQAQDKFEKACIAISALLKSIASSALTFNFQTVSQQAAFLGSIEHEWRATLHPPNDNELALFRRNLVLMKTIAARLAASENCTESHQSGELRTPGSADNNGKLNVVSDSKAVTVISPNDRLRQYRLMVSTSQDMLAMIDREYRYVIANPSYAKAFCNHSMDITGKTVEEVLGREFFYEKAKKRIDRTFEGKPQQFETSVGTSTQEHRHMSVSYEPYMDMKGNITGLVVSAKDITDRKQIEEELKNNEGRFRLLADLSPVGIFRKDCFGEIIYVNKTTSQIIGKSRTKCMEEGWNENIFPDDSARVIARWDRATSLHHNIHEEFRLLKDDGDIVWIICEAVPSFDANKSFVGYIGTLTDITEIKTANEKDKLASTVFESTKDGIIITDADTQIISVNPSFEKITGYSEEEVIGAFPSVLHSGKQNKAFYEKIWCEINLKGSWHGELWNRRKNGDIFPTWLSISSVRNEEDKIVNYVSVFSDISEVKKSAEQLSWLAFHDPLTQLSNRLMFTEKIEHSIARAKREQSSIAVLFFDFDRFKHVNDSLGHGVGDELLIKVAQRLRTLLRENDSLSRFGGDEFTILIENYSTISEVYVVAEKVIGMFLEPFEINEHHLYTSISMGISVFPTDGATGETLLRNADSAMYRAKEKGGNDYEFYTTELTESAHERVRLESGIRNAIKKGEMAVHFQPQVELETGKITGAEALVRWFSPDLGQVSPSRFIPIAEESTVIHELGSWVLFEACAKAAEWTKTFNKDFRVAVNISSRQIQKNDFIDVVTDILDRTGLSGHNLELEVTEGVVMRQAETGVLERLKSMGIMLSIDDFGTGYSSLSYLRNLPVDRLKIDQMFVKEICEVKSDVTIVRSVIAMGHAMGLNVMAEGVETKAQLDVLKKENCDGIQGYFIGKPTPAKDFESRYFLQEQD
ncbi:bifunctional diguanylate cyclase/phosphodiesterase [Motiliproteus sp. MSK22-1]|uniref:sensor domain-containing protein n=1 Tax=Motiliproteus sp. MSK22-1 TaxID=1897630 RepID=UPI000977835E|nr:bifunctional diguanylate cyclase/phosphodiesterase [Motiliproteus sp. MSK22-1]OMH32704.1 hypothetical protein BGP75_14315 [Motiliproteus sp. MSK22-1]